LSAIGKECRIDLVVTEESQLHHLTEYGVNKLSNVVRKIKKMNLSWCPRVGQKGNVNGNDSLQQFMVFELADIR
jgi:hypothetical protein